MQNTNSPYSIRLEDIARQLKLSVATISRALSGDPKVKTSTRNRVLQTAARLGYVPNTLARSLRNGRTNTLGVLLPKYDDPFFMEVIKGIESLARQRGYKVLISSSEQSYQQEYENILIFQQGIIDGLLLCLSKETINYQHLHNLISRNIPLVQFDCVTTSIDSDQITSDDLDGAFTAVKYLIELGHRRIAYIGGPKKLENYQNRYQGFLNGLNEYQLKMNPDYVLHTPFGDFEEDGAAINAFIDAWPTLPDAIFASTDTLAILAMKKLKKLGHQIPKDIAIVGFGNLPLASICEPELTTIAQPSFSMGELAAKLLLDRINQPNQQSTASQQVELKTKLIIRESA